MKQKVKEKLAVLDEFGNLTGKVVQRKKAHKKGILHGTSHLYIYRKNAKGGIDILLQRRSPNKDSFPNCLDISSAGHMIDGMTFEETAQKELEEELGIKIDIFELDYAFTQRISQKNVFRGQKFIDNEINRIYLLMRDLDLSQLKLQEEEVSEAVWMDSEEIRNRLEAGDKEICLSIEEYNSVLRIIRRKLQENRLAYLKIEINSSIPGNRKEQSIEKEKER